MLTVKRGKYYTAQINFLFSLPETKHISSHTKIEL